MGTSAHVEHEAIQTETEHTIPGMAKNIDLVDKIYTTSTR